MAAGTESGLAQAVHDFVLDDFTPHFDELADRFDSNPLWRKMRELGSELWLDTGSIDDVSALWTREFTALTTNNTLLNKEVQSGQYDDLVVRAAELLSPFDLSPQEEILEIAFILNARHALRLVEQFDAYVSVEEHTDLAHDIDAAVATARRYHAICPERFYVKIPFTAEGLIATRRARDAGVPVNHTLGFSARQNCLITHCARPNFVNVFLGRLNSFVVDNGLGDGAHVGEKATLASQRAVRKVRDEFGVDVRQIAASMRNGQQVIDLAGVDVLTMPPKVARDFLEMSPDPADLTDRTGEDYEITLAEGVDPHAIRIDTLWDVKDRCLKAINELNERDPADCAPGDLETHLTKAGCGDLLFPWTERQRSISRDEGKIPRIEHWREGLGGRHIGLDTLMNLAGLNSFISDQAEMDEKVRGLMAKQS